MRKITTEEYKQVVLEILLRIDEICKNNGLRYMISYGTLLGAVRHQGFIPWDDDIDIVMTRDEYDKLCQIVNGNDSYHLRFLCIESSDKSVFVYGKVCDTRTKLRESNFIEIDGYGAYVDVFPLDHLPDSDEEEMKIYRKYIVKIKALMHSTRTGYQKSNSMFTNIERFLAFHLCKMINPVKMARKLNKEFRDLNQNKTEKIGIPWAIHRIRLTEQDFNMIKPILFEGHYVMGPQNPDSVLSTLYGDYMKLPSEEARVSNHLFECYYIDEEKREK